MYTPINSSFTKYKWGARGINHTNMLSGCTNLEPGSGIRGQELAWKSDTKETDSLRFHIQTGMCISVFNMMQTTKGDSENNALCQ